MQRLGAEVDRVQEQRLSQALTTTPTGGGVSGAAASQAEGSGDATAQASALSGLRRVLLSVRKEKELAEAKFAAATHQASLKEQLANHLRRELDDARAQLASSQQQARDDDAAGGGGGGSAAAAAHAKLVAQLEENNLFRESNATLRAENGRLTNKLAAAEAASAGAASAMAPMQEELRRVSGELAAAQAENTDLKESLATWKQRVEGLTARYKLVDPDDHARAVADLSTCKENLEKARAQAATQLADATKEREALATSLKQELQKAQAAVEAREAAWAESKRTADADLSKTTTELAATLAKLTTASQALEAAQTEADRMSVV